ncbi:MAG: VWA domain-containing protein [Acidobacteria bacterium]|nr:VWA domain-containing protein [Acidobacteriota bacterium]MCW5966912.1 VWA domain-containing protein [Blastocatellales bacterium]
MRSALHLLLALSLVAPQAATASTFIQSDRQTGRQNDQTIRIGTAEVALDVVVRDKRGRPVKDLTAADFEVYEDGVRQPIQSFRLVARETSESTVKPTTPAAPIQPAENRAPSPAASDTGMGPGVIALVFDRMSAEARGLVQRMAAAYAEEGLGRNDFTGVFGVDLSLHTIQNYTDDRRLIAQAIERATARSVSTFASTNEQVRGLSSQSAGLERSGAAAESAATAAGAGRDSAGAAAAGADAGAAAVEMAFGQMNIRMLETFEMLSRNQQGYATVYALIAVINSLRNLPGRKTMIFFSEGVAIPPAVHARFLSVIHAANRANVSIYAVDAAGLRTESVNAEAAREINAIAARRSQQLARSRDDTSGPMMRGLERNEDLLRLNPHTGLAQLAEHTGGFLIANTNDLTSGLRRIDEDLRVHYMLSYAPTNPDYDGKFRQISVKLNRPNLDVQTRRGYYAIDSSSASPVLDYEIPALAALNSQNRANTFALRAGGFHFPDAKPPGPTPILAEVPLSSFTFKTDKEKKTYSADFTIVAVVRDETRQIVQKASQMYPITGPADKLETVRKDEVLFYRELDLAPGRYTLDTVAYDAPTGRSSVVSVPLEVPDEHDAKLRVSSLMLLKRADRLTAEEQKQDRPFHFGEVIVYPNLGQPLQKATSKQLAFFFTVWSESKETPKLTIEIFQQGQRLAGTAAELSAADANGRIKYASALPLEGFPPGRYELKITVADQQSAVTRATPFTVE